MRPLLDARLRRLAEATSDEMDCRIEYHEALVHSTVGKRLDALEDRMAETERILGIERNELGDVVDDMLTSEDEGVFWADMEERRVPPKAAQKMIDRFKDQTRL